MKPTTSALALLLLGAPASAQPEPFPLTAGSAAVTCFSGADPGGFVAAVFDLSDPAVNAPGLDVNWTPPVFHDASWTAGTFGGEVFGLALDDAPAPNLYLTSTSTYGRGQLGSGKVYKIDGQTAAVSVLADLPNCGVLPCLASTGPGLGNVAFDPVHRQLFVTNFRDGRIYRLSLSGEVRGTFDPFVPFDPFDPGAVAPAPGFAPLGERPWGIAVFAGRVYFGVWSSDYRVGSPNTVWSVGLDAAGAFTGSARLEVTLPLAPFPSSPVSDITFTAEGRMLLAQRTMVNDASPAAHQSAVLEFIGGPGAWTPSGRTFSIGIPPGRNAAGGVAAVTADGATTFVLATGDALHFAPGDRIYGLQILPANGGATADSYLVDLDGDVQRSDKLLIGDVETPSPSTTPPPVYADVDIILHTGWDRPNQRFLPPGADDDEWTVKVGGATAPAKVVVEPLAAWRDPFQTGTWIGATASGLAAAGASTVTFERCFCLGPDATDFEDGSELVGVIKLRLYADDEALVRVNGVPVGFGGAFRRALPLKFNVEQPVTQGLLRPGETNCIQVDVPNRGVGTGLDLVGKVWLHSASCEPVP